MKFYLTHFYVEKKRFLLAEGHWFSTCTLVSFITETDIQDKL